jgi:RecA/RadA recombinase
MSFISDLNKDLEKAGIMAGSGSPPKYWFSSGNFVLNKILSGSFMRFIPQGRIVCFAGPSGTGKSFLAANAAREAQKEGAFVVPIDTENALDDDFMTAVGVDVKDKNYMYVPANTIEDCKKTVSKIVAGYESEYADDENAPRMLILIDSVDMLLSEAEQEQFKKGIVKGDMGQRNKQLKSMLRSFVQALKNHNISMIITHQVYKNQDLMNGEGNWIVADAIKYSLSQIVMLTKLKLRDKSTKETTGIRMKCEGYKTRFTRPFQTVTIEVPYEEGMDPYNGLLDVAVEMGIIKQKSSWYTYGNNKFQAKNFDLKLKQAVLIECEAHREKFLEALDEDEELTPQQSAKKQRMSKMSV